MLPVRDGAAHLPQAIESLRAQTLADFEVIAVDDGSRDATPELLAEWAADDARVRVLSQPPAGLIPALEAARAAARAPYLARMDADDVSEPARLERQLALMRADPSLVGCGCRVRYVPEEAVRDGARRYEAWLNACVTPEQVAREIFVECPLAHPAFFLRADRVADVDGYREPGWPEDYDLVLRLWKAGGRLANVPEILLRWREAPGRLSRTHPRYSPEAFRRCKVRFLLDTHLADGRAPVIWGAGPLGKAFARALIEAERPPGAFVDVDPRKVGQRIHGAPVLDPREGVTRADSFHLAAVGQPGARARIRGMLEDGGLVDGRDFTAVA